MKIDAMLSRDIRAAGDEAATLEGGGYDGVWVGETEHDAFLQVLAAARSTQRVTVGTAVAIAFARTPMTVAQTAFDLALYSEGRFVLGLGSQVKAHIERRFSMPWSNPAPRMREYVTALHAIWSTWQSGEKLDFRGDYYTHTLMTPFFSPAAHTYGPPPVYLAGVGEKMTEVAGELCEGFFFHPLTSARYLHEVTVPALERGRERGGRVGLEGFTVTGPAFTCVGRDERELADAIKGTRAQIAFYASTPAYRGVLELHGWEELQGELNALARAGRWSDMGDAIDDTVLHAFAVVGAPDEVGRGLHERWSGVAERITLYTPYKVDPGVLTEVVEHAR
ncbi:MAG TPA: TIGR03617 family F420-dependent LLM class oxidoreductase [Acidimicrobiales bacterium]|nr:TIGR03617 family F420-dependent LLM class oxidoreductase [Acidimicrobiales bacterium]